jgi:hypothetical protein
MAIKFLNTVAVDTDVLYVDASSNRVGIGTTSPAGKLDIRSSTTSNLLSRIWNTNTGTNSSAAIRIASSANTANSARLEFSDSSAYTATISGDRVQGLVFRTSTTATNPITSPERMRITSAGNVGVGTTNPQRKLEVVGKIRVSDEIEWGWGGVRIIGSTTTNDFRIKTWNGSSTQDRLIVDGSGNVGIGTTSPSYKLDVRGDIGTDRYIRHTGDTNTYFGFSDPDTIQFNTAGSERLRINSSGNVGIGTTSPSEKLDITGQYGSTTLSGHVLGFTRASANYLWAKTSGGDLRFTVNGNAIGSPSMIINPSGNVGIGTTSPTAPLTVKSNSVSSQSSGIVLQANGSTDDIIRMGEKSTNGGRLHMLDGGVEKIAFYTDGTDNHISAGNVGIGTNSPSAKLHIDVPTEDNQPAFKITKVSDSGENAMEVYHGTSSALRGIADFTNSLGSVMFLRGDGNVGIGTTSPGRKLEVAGDVGINGYIYHNGDDSRIGFEGNDAIRMYTANNVRLQINSNGNVGIGTTSPGAKLEISHSGTNNGLLLENTLNSSNYQIALNIRENEGLIFQRWIAGAFNGNLMRIGYTGAIKFDAYDSTNNTGTPTYLLGTDASGNVVKTNTVPGSGAGPYLPLAGGTMTGNTTHGDNVKSIYGAGGDLQIYHDGSNSFIDDSGTGDLYVRASDNMYFQTYGSGKKWITLNENAGVQLFHNDSKKFETTSTGVTITGGWVTSGVSVAQANVEHIDNAKAMFGNGNDLQIYHDGTHSWISDQGAGNLTVLASAFVVNNASDTENMIIASSDGSVNLYYDGSQKFRTISAGVEVTGAATATTFLGDLNGTINTATTAVTKANATNDTTVATTAFVQNLIGTIPAGLVFQGTWNASTNTPTLTSGSGTTGHFYIVSTDGSTNLDGITDWKVGDWAVFVEQGATDAWEKVDNSSVLDGSGTGQKVTMWSGSGTSNTLTDAPITVSSNDSTFAGNITTTSTATGAITLDGGTGVSTSGAFILRQNGDGANNGMAITSSHATSHRIWKDASGNLNIGSSGNTNAFKQDITGNVTIEGDVTLADNKKLTFGAAPDFEIYHNSTTNVNHISSLLGRQLSISSDTTIFSGDVLVEDNLYLTDAGTVRGKIQLNSSDRDDVDIKAVSLGSNMKFFTVNTERMRIDSDGNVGIGATNPQSKLQINDGSVNITKAMQSGGVDHDFLQLSYAGSWGNNVGGLASINFTDNLSSSNTVGRIGVTYTGSQGKFVVTDLYSGGYGASGDVFTIQANGQTYIKGNVGIGTTSPNQSNLVVSPSAQSADVDGITVVYNPDGATNRVRSQLKIDDFSGVLELTNSADTIATYITAGGDSYFTAGNVGIGTTNPAQKFVVADSTNGDGIELVPGSTSVIQAFDRTASLYNNLNIDAASTRLRSTDYTSFYNGSGFPERMRIDSSGNVLVGVTSNQTQSKLTSRQNGSSIEFGHLNQNGQYYGTLGAMASSGSPFIAFSADNSVANSFTTRGAKGFVISQDTNISGDLIFSSVPLVNTANQGLAERMRIDSSGNVGIGTTSPSAPLDVFGVRAGRDWAIADRAVIRLDSNGVSNPSDILFGHTAAANQTSWTGAYWSLSSRGSSADNKFHFYRGNGNPDGSGEATIMTFDPDLNVGIGTTSPQSKLQVDGGVQMADDTDAASADKVGTMRYRTGTEYVEVTGTELVTNGDFAIDSSWTKETGWSIASGKASYDASSATNALYQSIGLTTGSVYRLSFTVVNYTSGSFKGHLSNGDATAATDAISANGDYSFNITATGPLVLFRNVTSFNGSIDNVSLVEVTAEDASYADMCMQTGSSTYEWVNIVRNTY